LLLGTIYLFLLVLTTPPPFHPAPVFSSPGHSWPGAFAHSLLPQPASSPPSVCFATGSIQRPAFFFSTTLFDHLPRRISPVSSQLKILSSGIPSFAYLYAIKTPEMTSVSGYRVCPDLCLGSTAAPHSPLLEPKPPLL
jgi:hypothetical protein